MTLDHLREIALIQISQAQRTNAMNTPIRATDKWHGTDQWKNLDKVKARADACGPGVKVAQDAPYIGYRIMLAHTETDLPIVYRT